VDSPSSSAHPSLLADMRLALLAELGARAVYERLGRRARGKELVKVLAGLHAEEVEQVERLRGLLVELGGRAPLRSRRRAFTAALLCLASYPLGVRFALRVCCDAEATVARWYGEYAQYLAANDRADAARRCEDLALTKRRHAQVLQAWVEHGARRS
jgi:rubrerythrin